MTKRCPQCGRSLASNDSACAACGPPVEHSTPRPARPSRRLRVLVLVLLAGLGAVAVALVGWQNVRDWVWLGPQELRLCNRATCTGARDSEGRLRYEWTAYLEGPPERLREIQFVEYHLPPRTFAAPVRKVTHSPEDGFALTMNGWGTFRLRATVTFKDGTTLELTHDLEF